MVDSDGLGSEKADLGMVPNTIFPGKRAPKSQRGVRTRLADFVGRRAAVNEARAKTVFGSETPEYFVTELQQRGRDAEKTALILRSIEERLRPSDTSLKQSVSNRLGNAAVKLEERSEDDHEKVDHMAELHGGSSPTTRFAGFVTSQTAMLFESAARIIGPTDTVTEELDDPRVADIDAQVIEDN